MPSPVSRWFTDLRVRTKILTSVLVIAVVMTIACGTAVWRMADMNDRMATLRSVNVQSMTLLGAIQGAQSAINHYSTALVAADTPPAARAAAGQGQAAAMKQLDDNLDAYEK